MQRVLHIYSHDEHVHVQEIEAGCTIVLYKVGYHTAKCSLRMIHIIRPVSNMMNILYHNFRAQHESNMIIFVI